MPANVWELGRPYRDVSRCNAIRCDTGASGPMGIDEYVGGCMTMYEDSCGVVAEHGDRWDTYLVSMYYGTRCVRVMALPARLTRLRSARLTMRAAGFCTF